MSILKASSSMFASKSFNLSNAALSSSLSVLPMKRETELYLLLNNLFLPPATKSESPREVEAEVEAEVDTGGKEDCE